MTRNIPANAALQKKGIEYKLSPAGSAAMNGFLQQSASLSPVAYRLQGYRYKQVGFFVSIENLFDAQWREAQFFFASQLRTEAAPVNDIHFTPGVPRTFLLGMSLYF